MRGWWILPTLTGALIAGSGCRPYCVPTSPQPSGAPSNEVFQEFSASAGPETAWRVRWAQGPGRGLYITGAWFRRVPTESWMRILYDARVAELFVPYHSGSPRFYDLTSFNFPLVHATDADRGYCGRLLGTPPVVVKEVRDRGLAWKDDQQVHRGRELVLWSTLDAANYNYIIEYHFVTMGDPVPCRGHRPEPARGRTRGPHAQRPVARGCRPERVFP